jgi:hypothetical protein
MAEGSQPVPDTNWMTTAGIPIRERIRTGVAPGPDQLDVRACPTWPLRSFLSRERLALELVVEVDLLGEDDVDGACDLLLDEGACDGGVLVTCLLLVEALDLRVVLDSAHGRVAEHELDVAVAVLAVAVPALGGRVVGSGHDAAIAEELLYCRKALDAVDLEVEREGDELADPRDPEQTLDVGVGDELGIELLLDAADLVGEQLDLLGVE